MSRITENSMEEALSSIKRVEANPYLITRIKDRIKQSEMASAPSMWGVGLSFVLILAVNLIGFSTVSEENISQTPQTEMYNLLPQNGLYD